MSNYQAEPWKIKMVEPIRQLSRPEREAAIVQAGYNTCLLDSRDVYIDLFSDSGVNAMSDRQWAAMMVGDEAYAGSASFTRLADTVRAYYGYPEVIPTHQGRGAEHILNRMLVRPGQHCPGNMYFPSTRVHQELNGGAFHDVIIDEAHDPSTVLPFKGNVDCDKLEKLIAEVGANNIPYLALGAPVNMAGGQPVSMANIDDLRALTSEHGIPLILDAARAVENAWFIQQREAGWANASIAEILRAMCDRTDGATMSAKKDSYANIGGWLGLRDAELATQARGLVVLFEGLHTYGGMAGRDMEAVAQGIEESVAEDNIRARIQQVGYLGDRLAAAGVPVMQPIGGHCVCIDAAAFLPHIPRERFPAQALAAALYVEGGVRGVERGMISAGRDPDTGENRTPNLELVRLAIPRRVYTQAHLDVVAEAVISLWHNRDSVRGLRFVHEPRYLRFFQAHFAPVD
ncbi:tyrosine phenol-lyase [Tamaricihabitans halophyticus]|uniref:Tyrosine phenol-lyase n=1 Tax=Tamaricihabitans halophyticus TaxID=1262583 RepID=A0A4R2QPQ7_9PSEU|nr:tryptophanase [Tamaricihabitans halophyticus]TCP50919.1 tyrosine phenol-lyase [Tamaricihabitans halophyticus]